MNPTPDQLLFRDADLLNCSCFVVSKRSGARLLVECNMKALISYVRFTDEEVFSHGFFEAVAQTVAEAEPFITWYARQFVFRCYRCSLRIGLA